MEKLHAGADGDQIGCNVEGVGHNEADEEHGEDCTTGAIEKTLDGQFAESAAGRKGRAITSLLDGGHQRQRQKGRPQERQAVLGSRLGVGGDSGGVVVGRPGDQSRSEGPQILSPDRSGARFGEIELRGPP